MPIDDIFQEYVRMRGNGLETKEALKALRLMLESLDQQTKETLALKMRQWERDHSSDTRAVDAVTPYQEQAFNVQEDTNLWIACANCQKKNRITEIFCYACGSLLDNSLMPKTQHFADATNTLFGEEHLGEDSVVEMIARDSNIRYEVRPQLRQHELIMGRSTNGALPPDVDFAQANAADLGVSRLHMAMRYEAQDNTVHIYDLGSANGSYVNGQRLHPKEVRVLRSGDEVRLGRLVLKVKFLHPGEKL